MSIKAPSEAVIKAVMSENRQILGDDPNTIPPDVKAPYDQFWEDMKAQESFRTFCWHQWEMFGAVVMTRGAMSFEIFMDMQVAIFMLGFKAGKAVAEGDILGGLDVTETP